ncbi:tetratricopeptide repeat protein [Megalodesulfovibrio gigas]|uniref:Putative tetratricopeptide repeat family protein n=1 Tax=Megalodesulfovibrio gigas (strain ATCC 19364 / DSM 1382 / NCIMB 9332 / VKM B-1759) TaxID=1121448 RepID=T2GFS0_MEGG1|nr:tetratricopeptide repeat protein [Megalodesulfovibrio gigas]AGW15138.1 putative tetratricopeptide repeat family protein [Megalodesulfovibrio gigas DSM 1382 = ATCC 19364]
MRRHTILPLLSALLAGCLLLAACATVPKNPAGAAAGGWKLSKDAQATYYYLLLEDARRQENATLGEQAVLELLSLDDSPQVFIDCANFFWQAGDAARTRILVEEGQQRHPNNLQLQLLLAQLYLAEQRYDEARTLLEHYLTRNPGDLIARTELATMLVQAEVYEQAMTLLEQTPASIPQEKHPREWQFLRAKALTGLERHKEAVPILKALLKEDPEFLEAWAELAYAYEAMQDFKGAEETYLSIMELGEPSRELILRLAEVNIKLGKPKQALKFVEKGPQDLPTFLPVAGYLLDAGMFDEADAFIDAVLKEHPDFKELWFHKALIQYEGRKDSAKALECLRQIPESSRFHERSQRFSIHLLFEADRTAEALALARASRARYADVSEFWLLEARLLQESGQTEQALDLLRQAQERWSDDPEVLFTYGLVLERAEQRAEAFAVMERILDLEPDNADALNYVGYTLADKGKDLDRAQDLVARALELKPGNDYILDSMAWVRFRQGQIQEAWAIIQQAVVDSKGQPVDDPVIWEHYGDIALALGHTAQARTGYENALKYHHKKPETIRKKLQAL